MDTFRFETTIDKDGNLAIKGLPLPAGEKVEVIINRKAKRQKKVYPLRGKPYQYFEPYNSVSEDEWNALK